MFTARRVWSGLAIVGLAGVLVWLWSLERSYELQPLSEIEDGLCVGGLLPAPPPGTLAVLNLCDQPDSYGVPFYRHAPLDGSIPPDLEWLRHNVQFIAEQHRLGNPIYVHCLAGMNRSGMVVTAYLMHKHSWTRDQSLRFAQSKRPQIQPNPSMMRLLAEWERELCKRPSD